LRKFGWVRKRSSRAGRPWVFEKPDGWPVCMNLDALEEPDASQDAQAGDRAPEPPVMAEEPADYDDRIRDPF
jgi:hypothetical protein